MTSFKPNPTLHEIATRPQIVVTEAATRKEIDCFPISLVSSPVHLVDPPPAPAPEGGGGAPRGGGELYNSVVVFTVKPDAASGRAPPELNLFHCTGGVNVGHSYSVALLFVASPLCPLGLTLNS